MSTHPRCGNSQGCQRPLRLLREVDDADLACSPGTGYPRRFAPPVVVKAAQRKDSGLHHPKYQGHCRVSGTTNADQDSWFVVQGRSGVPRYEHAISMEQCDN